jgi:hypothetical protein
MSSNLFGSRSPVNHQRLAINQQTSLNSGRTETRSPTIRESTLGPRSPQLFRNPTPNLIEAFIKLCRAELNQQREKEKMFIEERRIERMKIDEYLDHMLDIVNNMRHHAPDLDVSHQHPPIVPEEDHTHLERAERLETEFMDAEEPHHTIERDRESMLDTQDNPDTRWIPGHERMNERSAPRDVSDEGHTEQSSSPPSTELVQDATVRNLPSSSSLHTPSTTPQKKRKRTEAVNMGPPPIRKAAKFSRARTMEMWKFSEKDPRQQSVDLLARTAPIISCHCRQLNCAICKSQENIREYVRKV